MTKLGSRFLTLSLIVTGVPACADVTGPAATHMQDSELGSTQQALLGSKFEEVLMTDVLHKRFAGINDNRIPAPVNIPNLPKAYSVARAMSSVKNQGRRGTCATFSALGVAERYVGLDLSEQCVVKEIGGNKGERPYTRFNLLTASGAIHEDTCPYDAGDMNVNIPAAFDYDSLAKTEASTLLEYNYWQLENMTPEEGLQRIREEIGTGHPVAIGVIVPDDQQNWKTNWDNYAAGVAVTLPPNPTCNGVPVASAPKCDGHSIAVVGYDDDTQMLTIKNSWGTGWKDDGYGQLEYAYFKNLGRGYMTGLRPKARPLPPAAGDFNGDGRDDMIIVTRSGSFEYLGNADGSFTADAWIRSDLPLGSVNFVPGDFNGDKKTDLVIETRFGTSLVLGKAEGGFTPPVWSRPDLTMGRIHYNKGNFNGDKYDDLLITTFRGSFLYLGKAVGGFDEDAWTRGDLGLGQVNFTPADFNGDGRTDLIVTIDKGSYWYAGKADGTFTHDVYMNTDLTLGSVQFTPGDFNGDGRSDVIATTVSGSVLYTGRADGKLDVGSFNRGDLTLGRAEYVATDVNNDGKTDVMITTVWGSYLYLGRSDGFSQDHLIYEGLELGRVSFFPSDFNGDNYGDLMISTANGSFLYTGKRDGTFKPDVYIRPGLKLFGVSFY